MLEVCSACTDVFATRPGECNACSDRCALASAGFDDLAPEIAAHGSSKCVQTTHNGVCIWTAPNQRARAGLRTVDNTIYTNPIITPATMTPSAIDAVPCKDTLVVRNQGGMSGQRVLQSNRLPLSGCAFLVVDCIEKDTLKAHRYFHISSDDTQIFQHPNLLIAAVWRRWWPAIAVSF